MSTRKVHEKKLHEMARKNCAKIDKKRENAREKAYRVKTRISRVENFPEKR